MIDMLSFVSIQVFPTLLMDIFKYLSRKRRGTFSNRRFSYICAAIQEEKIGG
jgi:hypothetical protein